MSDPAIAAMIREVLAEELKKVGRQQAVFPEAGNDGVREEEVVIATNGDLAAFVEKLLGYARSEKTLKQLESGRLTFRLAGSAETPAGKGSPAAPSTAGGVVSVAAGFFSERQVDQLPKGTAAVRLHKAAKLTPLARDRLRLRGIKIERTDE